MKDTGNRNADAGQGLDYFMIYAVRIFISHGSAEKNNIIDAFGNSTPCIITGYEVGTIMKPNFQENYDRIGHINKPEPAHGGVEIGSDHDVESTIGPTQMV